MCSSDLAHDMAHDGGVGDACGGGAHQDLYFRVVLADQVHQALFHMGADGGRRQGQAVVAVDGALDAGSLGEGLVGPQKDRSDREQVMGNGVFQTHVVKSSYENINLRNP